MLKPSPALPAYVKSLIWYRRLWWKRNGGILSGMKLFEDWEKRPQEWKDLIRLGFSEDPNVETDRRDTRDKFVEAMYFD